MSASTLSSPGAGTPLARSLATALLALLGLGFHMLPWGERADLFMMDASFGVLRAAQPKPAPSDIVIVGLDAATSSPGQDDVDPVLRRLPDVLVRVARGKPKAIALDVTLPSVSLDPALKGFDDAMATALTVAQVAAPTVIGMSVDARREVIPIHESLLRGVDSRAFAFRLLPRDDDGTVRQAVMALPTRQGNWPTLAGWLCEVLSGKCEAGLIDYALGPDYALVSANRLLEIRDDETLGRLFRGRVVFLAPVVRTSDRLPLAAPLADWEPSRRDAAAVLGHAQTLRTVLHGRPVREVPLPLVIAFIAAAALLSRLPKQVAFTATVAAIASALTGTVLLLRFGFHLPVTAALATMALAPIVARRLG